MASQELGRRASATEPKTLDRMDRSIGLGVSAGWKWNTFIQHRVDGTQDRMHTSDPEAAAFVIRAWERDPRTKLITIEEGGRTVLIFGERDGLSYLHDIEEGKSLVLCHNEWCPFFPDPRFGDICRKCPSGHEMD